MALKSWVRSANEADSDFPIQNLPYGVFRNGRKSTIGVAIGDMILDLRACSVNGLFSELPKDTVEACTTDTLNSLMSLGPLSWSALRRRITAFLDEATTDSLRKRIETLLVPQHAAEMQLPAQIGDYTDFYASIHHATRVGKLFRPDSPLLPNYKHIPIGYHGRASSVVISGNNVVRPAGQIKQASGEPLFGPSKSLDYELEIGAFIGPGNPMGQSIPIADADQHIFGLCLLNDWSARDIQSWEYQPLGPFLAKNFATTISPWVVPMEALQPFRVASSPRPAGDPEPLEYLRLPAECGAAFDVMLEVYLQSLQMRDIGSPPMLLTRSNLRDLYWTIPQMLTHHASNGCNLRPGDLLATGTISGPNEGSEGCLLEMKRRSLPLMLPGGETRTFLEDGDRVVFRGYCQKPGLPRIGFGECAATLVSAQR
jgi:fumarylacetoacetase